MLYMVERMYIISTLFVSCLLPCMSVSKRERGLLYEPSLRCSLQCLIMLKSFTAIACLSRSWHFTKVLLHFYCSFLRAQKHYTCTWCTVDDTYRCTQLYFFGFLLFPTWTRALCCVVGLRGILLFPFAFLM